MLLEEEEAELRKHNIQKKIARQRVEVTVRVEWDIEQHSKENSKSRVRIFPWPVHTYAHDNIQKKIASYVFYASIWSLLKQP